MRRLEAKEFMRQDAGAGGVPGSLVPEWPSFTLPTVGREDEELAEYDAVIADLAESTDATDRADVARAMLLRGDRLMDLGRNAEALAQLDELIARFPDDDYDIRFWVVCAFTRKGIALGRSERREDALASYEEAIQRSRGETEPEMLEERVIAMHNRGLNLELLHRYAEAVRQYEEVAELIERVGDALDLDDLDALLARAICYRGDALAKLGFQAAALEAYEQVVVRFEGADDLAVREVVGDSLLRKGQVLRDLGEHQRAIETADDLVARDWGEADVEESVAGAYLVKFYVLVTLKRLKDAIPVADALTARFGDSANPVTRLCVVTVLNAKVVALQNLGRDDLALLAAEAIVARYGADLDPRIEKIVAPHAHRLGRKASRLRLLGLG